MDVKERRTGGAIGLDPRGAVEGHSPANIDGVERSREVVQGDVLAPPVRRDSTPLRPIHREPDGMNPVRVWTQNDTGTEKVWVQAGGGRAVCLGALETISASTPLYHWNSSATVERWNRQGVTHEEMERRIAENIFSMGGGLYVSFNAADSQEFGAHLLVFEPARDFRVVAYEHVMGSIEDMAGVSRVTLNYALRDAGLSGVRSASANANAAGLRSTWINVLTEEPLQQMRAGSYDDIARAIGISAATKKEELVERLLTTDAEKAFDLTASATLSRISPWLVRMMRNKPLGRGEHDALWPTIRTALLDRPNHKDAQLAPEKLVEKRAGQQLLPALRREFAKEIDAELSALAARVEADKPVSIASIAAEGDPNGVAQYRYQKRFQFIRSAAALGRASPFLTAVHPASSTHSKDVESVEVRDPFGKSLLAAFAASGDPAQLFGAIEHGHAPPWDVGSLQGVMIDRFEAIARSGLSRSTDGLRQAHAALTRPDFDVARIGSRAVQGSPLRSTRLCEEELRRISEREARVLEANPFLAVELAPDPEKKGVLARWEYPSAHTWERFRDYLPAPLVARLEQASPLDENDPRFAQLTQELLKTLLDRLLACSQFSALPSLRYQLLEALQPFDAHNEAAIRAAVVAESKSAFILEDPRRALLAEPDAFAVELAAAEKKHTWIALGFAAAEKERPGGPLFYDRPELGEVKRNDPARA